MNNDNRNPHCYDDIINLPHPVSNTHPHMPLADRAAQFSPFAALTGHKEAVKEAGRLTGTKIDLDENAKNLLDEKLKIILEKATDQLTIEITHFLPDSQKNGGSYTTTIGTLKKIDLYQRIIIMQDKQEIPIDAIVEINSELFNLWETL